LSARAGKLERLSLAEPIGPAQWSLRPGLEPVLRDLAVCGDIIKTMYLAIQRNALAGALSKTLLRIVTADDEVASVVGSARTRSFFLSLWRV
jgi:hypothetical protein